MEKVSACTFIIVMPNRTADGQRYTRENFVMDEETAKEHQHITMHSGILWTRKQGFLKTIDSCHIWEVLLSLLTGDDSKNHEHHHIPNENVQNEGGPSGELNA